MGEAQLMKATVCWGCSLLLNPKPLFLPGSVCAHRAHLSLVLPACSRDAGGSPVAPSQALGSHRESGSPPPACMAVSWGGDTGVCGHPAQALLEVTHPGRSF